MLINKQIDGTKLTIALEGRLETTAAYELAAELRTSVKGIKELIFDMTKLDYVSSAGLRVLQRAQQVMNKQDNMTVKNANSDVRGIFEVTGFNEIMNIE